jgi:hypothetical protein
VCSSDLWQKNKSVKVTLKDKIASMRIGETAQFYPNHGPYYNWAGEDVPLQSEKVPPFNTWWKQPNKYKDAINPRGRQKSDMRKLYNPDYGLTKNHEVPKSLAAITIGSTIIIEVKP